MIQLKEILASGPALRPFSASTTPVLITDASPDGLGAVLEKEGRPVICVSRRLSKAERGYSQTQKEALGIFWSVKRLHKYLFGRQFHIVTDHKALQYIRIFFLSTSSTAMVQRWALALSTYNYTIQHNSGKNIPQADFLSRFAACETSDKSSSYLVQPLPFLRSDLIMETKKFYSDIVSAVEKGWSVYTKKKHPQIYSQREELSLSPDGVLSMGDRVIVPSTLRRLVLQDLHSGHFGMDKMKSLSRLYCWWPGINNDIATFVKNCDKCAHKDFHRPANLKPWPIPYEVWQRVHMDYCGPFLGKYYTLVLVDSYSKWPEVFLTDHATPAFTIRALRKCFSREGVPQCIVSDNGTPFTAEETRKWLQSVVCRIFSPPRHPQSNGAAENMVKTIKTAIESAKPATFDDLEVYR